MNEEKEYSILLLYKLKYILIHMSLFDILKDLTDNENSLNVKLCDGCNVVTDKLDFSKKEDLDKLKEAVDNLKSNDNAIIRFIKGYMGADDFDNTLDSIVDSAQSIYNKANPVKKTDKATMIRKEVDNSVMDKSTTISKPSEKVPEEMQKQISGITLDYLKHIIIPNANLTKEQLDSIYEGLFQFACWIYMR